jgi:hypothetical protein
MGVFVGNSTEQYDRVSRDILVNHQFQGAYKALDSISSYSMFIDTLPAAYLDTELFQCAILESKLTALESQVGDMPAGSRRDQLLAKIESSLEYVELKKERIIELEIKFQDEDYDQQLEMIRLHFKKSEAEFEYFIKEQKEFQNHLKSEAYWDRLLEVLEGYGSCYEHMHADSISNLELLELILNRNNVLSVEFEEQFRKSLELDSTFDDFYINEKLNKLKENPVEISVKQEGFGRHVLIYQHDGQDVRFNLQRDRMSNGFTASSMDDPYCDSDSRFLRLYAEQHMGSCGMRLEGSNAKSFTGLLEEANTREEYSDIAAETP